jgi:hypothetical protein
MVSRVTEVIIDCHDLRSISRFCCATLGYTEFNSGKGWVAISPQGTRSSEVAWRATPLAPAITFVVVPEGKVVKNRMHLDITPIDRTRDNEVLRLVDLGARPVDIRQGDKPWVVMADPEGNEFCVMPHFGNPYSAPQPPV